MQLTDLFRDARTGQLSHTKLWANVAYATGTAVVCKAGFAGTLTPDLLLVYLAVVGASATASKFLSLRYGSSPEATP